VTRSELYEHRGYWQDDVKLAAYSAAFEEVIQPGDRVLDLGAGTGLLGILAARAGAGQVWSYDYGSVLGLARDIARKNGVADRIHFVKQMTTEAELPEVDVIIGDQIGGLVYDAGVLDYYADAASRALRPGGTLVPGSFDVFLAPVTAHHAYREVDGWQTSLEIDLAPARRIAANTEHRIGPEGVELAAPGQRLASMASNDRSNFGSELAFTATKSATVHGLIGYFVAHMSPSVTLTNDPLAASAMDRWLNFYPFEQSVAVEAGQGLQVAMDVRPAGEFASWEATPEGGPTQRMSTFQGALMFETRWRNEPRRAACFPPGRQPGGLRAAFAN